jgi:phage-related minor tail protein
MTSENKSEFKVSGEELLAKIKELIHEGNVRKIIIKNEKGETYLEIPVTIGVIGAILAPIFAAIGALAALAANFTIEVERQEEN